MRLKTKFIAGIEVYPLPPHVRVYARRVIAEVAQLKRVRHSSAPSIAGPSPGSVRGYIRTALLQTISES
jgi:hypothetical protein